MRTASSLHVWTGCVVLAASLGMGGCAHRGGTTPQTAAGPDRAEPQTIAGLGTTSFATSAGSAAARTAFARGLLLLHLFEYPAAAAAFQEARALEPEFAMAAWGEAMTHNHGLWNQLDEEAGRAALANLAATPAERAALAPTEREKAYLAAVEILYSGEGSKPERDRRHHDAMAELAAAWPEDEDAQLFHALALMARSQGVRDVPDYLAAAAIARRVFERNPQSPGAAHYWIHGMDAPEHAAGALEAARALSGIAPDAGHAQHMTSHIFIALGMWDDVITANRNAMRVVDDEARAGGRPVVACGHYAEWLLYGYFQQGRMREAGDAVRACADSIPPALAWGEENAEALEALYTTPARYARRLNGALSTVRGIALVESRDWDGVAAQLDVDASGRGAYAAWDHFATGYAAAQRGDLEAARPAAETLRRLREDTPPSESELQLTGYLAVLDDALRGLLLIREEQTADGLAAIRQAAGRYDALAFDFGPPVPFKPPHELLGEELLRLGEAEAAIPEFRAALERAPERALALLGLARAQAAAQDPEAAATFRRLLDIWQGADEDLPELAEVRAFLGP